MRVDTDTFRGRIAACGHDVLTETCIINFNKFLRTVGKVIFIGLLLLIAGIESNPGPAQLMSYLTLVTIVVVALFVVQATEWKQFGLFLAFIMFACGLFYYEGRNSGENRKQADDTQQERFHVDNALLQDCATSVKTTEISPQQQKVSGENRKQADDTLQERLHVDNSLLKQEKATCGEEYSNKVSPHRTTKIRQPQPANIDDPQEKGDTRNQVEDIPEEMSHANDSPLQLDVVTPEKSADTSSQNPKGESINTAEEEKKYGFMESTTCTSLHGNTD